MLKKSVLRFHEFFREIARADKIFIVTFVTSDEWYYINLIPDKIFIVTFVTSDEWYYIDLIPDNIYVVKFVTRDE